MNRNGPRGNDHNDGYSRLDALIYLAEKNRIDISDLGPPYDTKQIVSRLKENGIKNIEEQIAAVIMIHGETKVTEKVLKNSALSALVRVGNNSSKLSRSHSTGTTAGTHDASVGDTTGREVEDLVSTREQLTGTLGVAKYSGSVSSAPARSTLTGLPIQVTVDTMASEFARYGIIELSMLLDFEVFLLENYREINLAGLRSATRSSADIEHLAPSNLTGLVAIALTDLPEFLDGQEMNEKCALRLSVLQRYHFANLGLAEDKNNNVKSAFEKLKRYVIYRFFGEPNMPIIKELVAAFLDKSNGKAAKSFTKRKNGKVQNFDNSEQLIFTILREFFKSKGLPDTERYPQTRPTQLAFLETQLTLRTLRLLDALSGFESFVEDLTFTVNGKTYRYHPEDFFGAAVFDVEHGHPGLFNEQLFEVKRAILTGDFRRRIEILSSQNDASREFVRLLRNTNGFLEGFHKRYEARGGTLPRDLETRVLDLYGSCPLSARTGSSASAAASLAAPGGARASGEPPLVAVLREHHAAAPGGASSSVSIPFPTFAEGTASRALMDAAAAAGSAEAASSSSLYASAPQCAALSETWKAAAVPALRARAADAFRECVAAAPGGARASGEPLLVASLRAPQEAFEIKNEGGEFRIYYRKIPIPVYTADNYEAATRYIREISANERAIQQLNNVVIGISVGFTIIPSSPSSPMFIVNLDGERVGRFSTFSDVVAVIDDTIRIPGQLAAIRAMLADAGGARAETGPPGRGGRYPSKKSKRSKRNGTRHTKHTKHSKRITMGHVLSRKLRRHHLHRGHRKPAAKSGRSTQRRKSNK
jgi:hypothetical protein